MSPMKTSLMRMEALSYIRHRFLHNLLNKFVTVASIVDTLKHALFICPSAATLIRISGY